MSSNSPCAACKFLRRKCTQECVFAPYFPPDQPEKFANVHKVFGASNVAKILNELHTTQREDAVNSLAFEARARLNDPVYGCVGLISTLQEQLKLVQNDLHKAKLELASYIGPSAMLPILSPGFIQQIPNIPSSSGSILPYNVQPILRFPGHGNFREAQILEARQQQLVAAAVAAKEQHDMLRNYEQQQQQPQPQFNGGFDMATGSGPMAGGGFSHMTQADAAMSPSLVLGGSYDNNMYQIHQQPPPQEHHHHQLQLQPQQLLLQQPSPLQRAGSEEGRSVGPSC